MKLFLAVTIAILAIVPSIAVADAVHNDLFDIVLPAGFSAFEEKSQSSTSDGTIMETRNWISKAPTGEAVIVTVSRMSGTILDPAKLMDSTRESLLKSLNATAESVEAVAGEVPASRALFRSSGPTPVFLRSWMAVRGDSLYQVLYVGRTEEQRAAPAVGQLFETFQLASAPVVAAGAVSNPGGSN